MKLTRYDAYIFILFLVALSFNLHFGKISLTQSFLFYSIGLAFELLLHKAFIYNKELEQSPLTLYKLNVNLTFALGWLSVAYLTMTVSGFFHNSFGWNLFFAAVVGGLLVGNILEQIFLGLKLWAYNDEHWLNKFGFKIFKIPVLVRLGYGVVGTVVYLVTKFL
ncbi:MAG: hypothetical protein HON76_07240 [Candidatus Scalindua sp.]|jgi:hypothetical protein|nr:hypothetical protein [Candidatus Scalindua sp.]MBT5307147.1 hypothetical protein [Candidatus Scalindua sp.]MBT6045571.1 hypothetical protein [Candidatus Scalindua sp.]MBT6225717.1 hypothetical protein [Candidatus Scalindua sp.]MBT6562304.1 hypothetical protein [Candidatus Scalindua sp.]